MTPSKPEKNVDAKAPRHKRPEWAGGLRRLYDDVVNEPLPDSFDELLRKLDGKDDLI